MSNGNERDPALVMQVQNALRNDPQGLWALANECPEVKEIAEELCAPTVEDSDDSDDGPLPLPDLGSMPISELIGMLGSAPMMPQGMQEQYEVMMEFLGILYPGKDITTNDAMDISTDLTKAFIGLMKENPEEVLPVLRTMIASPETAPQAIEEWTLNKAKERLSYLICHQAEQVKLVPEKLQRILHDLKLEMPPNAWEQFKDILQEVKDTPSDAKA